MQCGQQKLYYNKAVKLNCGNVAVNESTQLPRAVRKNTHAAMVGNKPAESAKAPWILTLSLSQRKDGERRIEDFRECWVRFTDAFREWVQTISEESGTNLDGYLERPQKL